MIASGRCCKEALRCRVVHGELQEVHLAVVVDSRNSHDGPKLVRPGNECAVLWATADIDAGGLPSGQVRSDELEPPHSVQDTNLGYSNGDRVLHVAEADVGKVVTDFAAGPDYWTLGFDGGSGGDGACHTSFGVLVTSSYYTIPSLIDGQDVNLRCS